MKKNILLFSILLFIGGISFYLVKYFEYKNYINQLKSERIEIKKIVTNSIYTFSDFPDSNKNLNRAFDWHYSMFLDEKLKSLKYGLNVYNDSINKRYIVYSFGLDNKDDKLINALNNLDEIDSLNNYSINSFSLLNFYLKKSIDYKLFCIPYVARENFCKYIYDSNKQLKFVPNLKTILFKGFSDIDGYKKQSFIDQIDSFESKYIIDYNQNEVSTIYFRYKENELNLICTGENDNLSQKFIDNIVLEFSNYFSSIDKSSFDYAFFPVKVIED